MSEQVNTNGGGGNLEQAKVFLTNNLNLSEHSCLAETLDLADNLDAPFPVHDLYQAAAALHGVGQDHLNFVLSMKNDPELVRATKTLMDTVESMDTEAPGSGKELLELVSAMAEIQQGQKGVHHA